MDDGSIEKDPASRPEWEHLEEWLRGQMQGLIQELLEAGGHRDFSAGPGRFAGRSLTTTPATVTATHRRDD